MPPIHPIIPASVMVFVMLLTTAPFAHAVNTDSASTISHSLSHDVPISMQSDSEENPEEEEEPDC
ncbi:MAG: hypothetical protein GKR95_15025 [Gammaproteobacteria bacterium]|nr:hypothetical protein [Gammaproteobacteria bacterium]